MLLADLASEGEVRHGAEAAPGVVENWSAKKHPARYFASLQATSVRAQKSQLPAALCSARGFGVHINDPKYRRCIHNHIPLSTNIVNVLSRRANSVRMTPVARPTEVWRTDPPYLSTLSASSRRFSPLSRLGCPSPARRYFFIRA